MKITQFAVLLTKQEGLKKQVNVAQMSEILKVQAKMLKQMAGIDLYKTIRGIPYMKVPVHKAKCSPSKSRRKSSGYVNPKEFD